MNPKKTILYLFAVMVIFVAATTVRCQQPDTKSDSVEVKSSPASDTLNQAAKELAASNKSMQEIIDNIRNGLNVNQKKQADQLTSLQKELQEKLKADKKYKPLMDQMKAIQEDLQEASQRAQQQFNQQTAPIQQKIQTDTALVQGLIPVVRKENDLPDTAKFDTATQKWKKAPEAAKK